MLHSELAGICDSCRNYARFRKIKVSSHRDQTEAELFLRAFWLGEVCCSIWGRSFDFAGAGIG